MGIVAHRHIIIIIIIVNEQCPACGKVFGSRPMAIEHVQCRARRCRRKMLDGLLPKLSSAVVTVADDDDRTAGLRKYMMDRFF